VTRPPLGIDRRPEQLRRFDVVLLMQAHVGRYAAPFIEAGRAGHPRPAERGVSDQRRGCPPRADVDGSGPRAPGCLEVAILRAWTGAARQRTVAVSEADALAFRILVPSASVTVRPSGADLRSLHYVDHAENRADRLIMTGTLGYLPNLDAGDLDDRADPPTRAPGAFLDPPGPRRCQRTESLRMRGGDAVDIVGPGPGCAAISGGSRPVRGAAPGRGRYPSETARGLRSRAATVATTVASAGIAVRHGSDIATADDEETFANEIIRLLDDVSARRMMAESARRLVEERYDWRTIAADYQKDLYDVVGPVKAVVAEGGGIAPARSRRRCPPGGLIS